jgi:hypothetical protein
MNEVFAWAGFAGAWLLIAVMVAAPVLNTERPAARLP